MELLHESELNVEGSRSSEISIFFRLRFELALEAHRAAKMFPEPPQEAEKGTQMLT